MMNSKQASRNNTWIESPRTGKNSRHSQWLPALCQPVYNSAQRQLASYRARLGQFHQNLVVGIPRVRWYGGSCRAAFLPVVTAIRLAFWRIFPGASHRQEFLLDKTRRWYLTDLIESLTLLYILIRTDYREHESKLFNICTVRAWKTLYGPCRSQPTAEVLDWTTL